MLNRSGRVKARQVRPTLIHFLKFIKQFFIIFYSPLGRPSPLNTLIQYIYPLRCKDALYGSSARHIYTQSNPMLFFPSIFGKIQREKSNPKSVILALTTIKICMQIVILMNPLPIFEIVMELNSNVIFMLVCITILYTIFPHYIIICN